MKCYSSNKATGEKERAVCSLRDFHIFLVDNSGLDQVIDKMRRMVLNLLQNTAGDVILCCDSKLKVLICSAFSSLCSEGSVVSAQHSEP